MRLSSALGVAVTVMATLAAAQTPALERFTVPSDGHPLAVWARRPASPRAAVLLVHGRTWSSRPDFDLQVPGLQRSVLSSLAANGVAAYAVDLRGYGETPRDATGWATPRKSAADVANVLTWIARRHPGLPRPALVGWSRGAAIAMLVAQTEPTRLSSLVLFGFAFDPSATFGDVPMPDAPAMEKNSAAAAASDFISPKVTPRAVVQAFVTQALRSDPVLADLKNDGEFSALNPARISMPTLVIFGERDPGVAARDAQRLVAALATSDKEIVVLPGADHVAQLEDTHDAWIAAVVKIAGRTPARR